MKTENDLNAHITSELKKLRPHVGVLKLSQKYHIGVSDFLVAQSGRAALVESKLVKEMPKRDGLVLKHPFEGPQLSFLKRFGLSETPVWGLIGTFTKGLELLWLVPLESIPSTGNWKKPEFLDLLRRVSPYRLEELHLLVQHMVGAVFGESVATTLLRSEALKVLSENT